MRRRGMYDTFLLPGKVSCMQSEELSTMSSFCPSLSRSWVEWRGRLEVGTVPPGLAAHRRGQIKPESQNEGVWKKVTIQHTRLLFLLLLLLHTFLSVGHKSRNNAAILHAIVTGLAPFDSARQHKQSWANC